MISRHTRRRGPLTGALAVGVVSVAIFVLLGSSAVLAATPDPLGSSFPTPSTTPAVTTVPHGPTNVLIKLPTFYFPVTSEGTDACSYLAGSPATTVLYAGSTAIPGPTLNTNSDGCITVSLLYVGDGQFEVYLGKGEWSEKFVPGTNRIVITGTSSTGGVLITTVQFGLGKVPGFGTAVAIKSKGISALTVAIILALLIDLLLAIAALLLQRMTRPVPPVAAGGDDEEEEEEEEEEGVGHGGFADGGPIPSDLAESLPVEPTPHVITRPRWPKD